MQQSKDKIDYATEIKITQHSKDKIVTQQKSRLCNTPKIRLIVQQKSRLCNTPKIRLRNTPKVRLLRNRNQDYATLQRSYYILYESQGIINFFCSERNCNTA